MSELPQAQGIPGVSGKMRVSPAHFQVTEIMPVEPCGDGEHLWLHLQKTAWNTQDLAQWLARAAGVSPRQVSYSGMKDRHAIARQWFSLHLPGRADPVFDWPDGVQCLSIARHDRKLRREAHSGNHFVIELSALHGDLTELAQRLAVVAEQGVPNYFGRQRFGHGAANLERGKRLLSGEMQPPRQRRQSDLWLSAVRSDLFNRVLAERVTRQCWHRHLCGDILQIEGRRSLFHDDGDTAIALRVAQGEVHPTAPLPGAGGMQPAGDCAQLEERILAPFHTLIVALGRRNIQASRRATRLLPQDMRWQLLKNSLLLTFSLPAGAFATSVLAELLIAEDACG